MCLIWPEWHKAFPDAKWIIVRRRTNDIVNSCMRTGFMNAFQTPEGWRDWVEHHLERFQEMYAAELNILEVWPSKFVAGDFDEIKRVIDALGLKWKEDRVLEFVEPALWSECHG